jgi:HK97 gp10 family phage protein
MSKDRVVCKVTGLEGVRDGLLSLEDKIARRLLRTALKNVGNFWVEAAKSHCPVDSGDLRDSIAAKVSTRKGKAKTLGLPTGSVTVGPMFGTGGRSDGKKSVPAAVYGMFVEFGLRNKKRYPKHPFLRPTFDSTKETVVEVFADTLRNGLEGAIKNGE